MVTRGRGRATLQGMDKAPHVRDLRHEIARDPVTVAYTPPAAAEVAVQGCRTTLDEKVLAMAAGRLAEYRVSVWTVLGDWAGTPPAADAVVRLENTSRRVLGTRTDSLEVGLRLDLGPEFAP